MSDFTVKEQPLIDEAKPVSELGQFKELSSGAGSSVIKQNQEGFFIGADNYTDAPFKVDYDGDLTITGGAISGGTITGTSISGGTIIGSTFKTAEPGAATGRGVVITGGTDKDINFYYNTTLSAYMGGYTDGDNSENCYLRIQSDSGRYLKWNDSQISCNGDFVPHADNDHKCGTSGQRWSVVYAEDMVCDDMTVNVSLDKPGGSFKIDHPLRPETHILRHSFVESPDMMNIYKGRVSVVGGTATVTLPDYFDALNKDIEYSLTPIGKLTRVAVLTEVQNNSFQIAADDDCDVSFIVYGVRKDKFAEENRIIVEEEKVTPGYMYGGYTDSARNQYSNPDYVGKLTKARKDEKLAKIESENNPK
jgi:hypothetical protein